MKGYEEGSPRRNSQRPRGCGRAAMKSCSQAIEAAELICQVQCLGRGFEEIITKEVIAKWSEMLHSFTKCRLRQTNLVSCFGKIIDFLDKRNEVDLISRSKVLNAVPRGKLLGQDKYLNSKTGEGGGAGSH